MDALNYLVLPNSLTVVVGNKDYVISDSHPNYSQVRDALKRKLWDKVAELVDIPFAVVKAAAGNVAIVNGEITFQGKPVHTYLATRILELMSQGFDVQPWVNFMNKLYDNPSYRSVEELYPFLEKGKLPICPDGDFLAYKYVRDNYKDQYSSTFDNSVGQVVTMPRNQVDDNKDRTCSAGLHFCSKNYLPKYGYGTGTRIVLVKVNPADVVSIPADHDDQKARTWRYEVVGELDEDYSFEDYEKSQVLPPPRDKQALNSTKGKPVKNIEDRIINYLNNQMYVGQSVRMLAKALKVTNSDIINSLGGKLRLENKDAREGPAVSNWFVYAKKKYQWDAKKGK